MNKILKKYITENLFTQGNKISLNHVKLNTNFVSNPIDRIVSTSALDLIELRPKKQRINYISVIKSLKKVEKVVENLASKGKRFLFLSTNIFHRYSIEREALICSEFFLNKFWIKGTLSNWDQTFKTLNKLNYLEKNNFPKYYSITQKRKIKKYCLRLKKIFDGIRFINQIPDVIIFTDPKRDSLALRECKNNNLTTIGIINTNNDPDKFEYTILGNNIDFISVDFFLRKISKSILKGKKRLII